MSRKFLVPIALPADPVNPLEAATKQYVDGKVVGGSGLTQAQADALYVNVTGDTMTGILSHLSSTAAGENNIVVGPVAGQAGDEGGQIGFNGTSGWPQSMYVDRLQNAFRVVLNTAVIASFTSASASLPAITFPSGNTLTSPVSDTWIRASQNFYVGSGILGCGPNGLSVNLGGAITAGYLADINGSLRVNGNIGFVPANPILSASSYIQMPGGLYVSGGTLYSGARINARAGLGNDQGALSLQLNNESQCNILSTKASAGNFGTQQLIMNCTSGAEVGISFWTQSYSAAPLMRSYGPFGERIDFLNSPNTAYTTICAGAFSVQSSLQTKRDVVAARDIDMLTAISRVRAHSFWPKIGPQVQRPTKRFAELDRRWQAKGRAPLRLTGSYTEAHEHDCSIDFCVDPCPVALNRHARYGLIAEDLHDVLPDTVWLDEDGLPGGYDVDQVAALAFGGVGALTRLIVALHERISDLEAAR